MNKFKVGDEVVCNKKANAAHGHTKQGWKGVVIELNPKGYDSYRPEEVVKVKGDTGTFPVKIECLDLIIQKQTVMKMFKIGDKVRIIGNSNNHNQKVGDIVTLDGFEGIKTNDGKTYELWNVNGYSVRGYDIELVKKEIKKEKYEVSVSFIKEAHNAACSEWKRKLEAKFPEVFVEEKTYKVGNKFKLGGETYLLARTGEGMKVVLIELESGNIYTYSVAVKSQQKITVDEMNALTADNFTYFTLIK